jgi:hypothetical protein
MSFISICLNAASQIDAPSHLDEIFIKYTEELAQEEYFQEIISSKTSQTPKMSFNKIKSQLEKKNRRKRAEITKKYDEESKEFEILSLEKMVCDSPCVDELNEMERLLESIINQNKSEISLEKNENPQDKYSLAINFIEKYQ